MQLTFVWWPSTRRYDTASGMEPQTELTDEQWSVIEDLFPWTVPTRAGGPPRPCLEGIVWVLRCGARWKDLPKSFPSYATCLRRLQTWSKSGVFQKAWQRCLRELDGLEELDWKSLVLAALLTGLESHRNGVLKAKEATLRRRGTHNGEAHQALWKDPRFLLRGRVPGHFKHCPSCFADALVGVGPCPQCKAQPLDLRQIARLNVLVEYDVREYVARERDCAKRLPSCGLFSAAIRIRDVFQPRIASLLSAQAIVSLVGVEFTTSESILESRYVHDHVHWSVRECFPAEFRIAKI